MEDVYTGLLVQEAKDVMIYDDSKYFSLFYHRIEDECKLNEVFIIHQAMNNEIARLTDLVSKSLRTCEEYIKRTRFGEIKVLRRDKYHRQRKLRRARQEYHLSKRIGHYIVQRPER